MLEDLVKKLFQIRDIQKTKKMIEVVKKNINDDSNLDSFRFLKNCDYEEEFYSPLAYDKFEKEKGSILKKKRR